MVASRREFILAASSVLPSAMCAGGPPDPARDWARTVSLRPDDITCVMGFDARLEGSLKPSDVRPGSARDFSVRGFLSPANRMTWTVRVPQGGDYSVALLYNGDNEVLRGCRMEITSSPSNRILREPLLERWWAPHRPFVNRHWLQETLPLKAGDNQVTFRLTTISEAQSKLGGGPLTDSPGSENPDVRVWSIEFVRPSALVAIKRRAQQLHSKHDWMVEGRYGLFTHYSALTYPFRGNQMAYKNWGWGVNLFDVQAYVDAVEQTGAKWVVFTLAHGKVDWPGPSRTLDRLLPGRTCKRDLLAELADALEKRGIRFSLYFGWGFADPPWLEACGMNDESSERVGDSFASLFEETSRRYGKQIWGFVYIDGCFTHLYQRDPPWEKWARAIKAGNRAALVGFSPNRAPNVTYFGDLQLGDFRMTLPSPSPPEMFAEGGPYEGVEPGWFIAMDGWNPRQPFDGEFHQGPRFQEREYVDYFKTMASARVPVTINLIITQDVTRRQPFFDPRCLAIMRAVRKAVQA